MHGRACAQTMFQSCNTATFNAIRFDENAFTCQCEKKRKKRRCLRVSNFILLLVVFKIHHGSEGVKPYKQIRFSSFDRRKLSCLPLQKKIWLSSIDRVKLGGTEENSVVFLWQKKIWLCFFNRRKPVSYTHLTLPTKVNV